MRMIVPIVGYVGGFLTVCGVMIYLALQGTFSWAMAAGVIVLALVVDSIGLIVMLRRYSR